MRVLLGQYESTGYLAKLGAVDVDTLRDTMGPGVRYDWELLSPVVAHYRDTVDDKV